MRRCESPDACKWPRCGCIEGLGSLPAHMTGTFQASVASNSTAAPDDPVKVEAMREIEQNVAGRDATQRGKPGSLVDVTSLSATSVDPVKELADHVAFYAGSWPVYEPGYVVSLATRLRKMEKAHARSHAEVLRLAEELRKAGKGAAPMHINAAPELADHVAFYADSWPVYELEPGYVASLATRLRELEGYKKAWEDYVSRIVAIDDAALTKEK